MGSFAASTLMSITKDYLREDNRELEQRLGYQYEEAMSRINEEHKKIVSSIMAEYEGLGTITEMAFQVECNAAVRFQLSIDLALAYNINDENILKHLDEVDVFFLG